MSDDSTANPASAGAETLIPLIYEELRALAAHKLKSERPGATLQATALVHEAYLRMQSGPESRRWVDSRHFFRDAAEAMRRILIDNARRKSALKRGGDLARTEFAESRIESTRTDDELLKVNELVVRLETEEPDIAELVRLRYFIGMTVEEAAKALDMSERTARRRWLFAKAWLTREMKK
jgi:RNA polymerase sigma factor (TIGR02999 family)